MNTKLIAIGIGVLFLVLVLVGNFISNLENKEGEQPSVTPIEIYQGNKFPTITSTYRTPTPIKVHTPTLPLQSLLDFDYPVEYKGVLFDLDKSKNNMRVFYRGTKEEAEVVVKSFFALYSPKQPVGKEVEVYMYGPEVDPSMPPHGYFEVNPEE